MRPTLAIPALLACLPLLAGPAMAADCEPLFEQARKSRAVADGRAARDACTKLAETGDPTGNYLLGLLQLEGIGIKKEPAPGIERIGAAAEAGLAVAQARLGRVYLRGNGVRPDPATAATWFQRAAAAGEPLAQYELGQLHYKGKGVAADPYEAYKWFSAAAFNYGRLGNVPRQKLAERKRATLAAELPAAERERADAWVAAQGGS